MISCHNYVVIDTHIATETMTETTTGTTMGTASSFPHSKNCQYYFCLENFNFVLILGRSRHWFSFRRVIRGILHNRAECVVFSSVYWSDHCYYYVFVISHGDNANQCGNSNGH